MGIRRETADPHGVAAIDTAVYALLGLLLAFSFYASADRYSERRRLAVDEANAIETVVLRLDMVPPAQQVKVRRLMREYVQARIAYNHSLSEQLEHVEWKRSDDLQDEMWDALVGSASNATPKLVHVSVLPAVNAMFDLAATQYYASRNHIPLPIVGLLIGLSLLAANLAGRSTPRDGERSWLHRVAFAGSIALTLIVVLDLDYPRLGLIRIDYTDAMFNDIFESLDRHDHSIDAPEVTLGETRWRLSSGRG